MTDFAVLGGGLAGVTLAWRLHALGASVRIHDRGEPATASRVAAGLLTPVTGQRPALSWRWAELAAEAFAFYPRVEAVTGARFFHPGPMVRLFDGVRERDETLAKAEALFRGHVAPLDPAPNPGAFDAPFGGVVLRQAARLDVPGYLDASRDYFARLGAYEVGEVPVTPGVAGHLGARRVIFCQGYAANPLFPTLRFAASKGEVLTLRVPGLRETRTVNRHGQWLYPVGDGLYRAGSTYDRERLDATPTEAGRAAILGALGKSLRLPVEVVGHTAAVRPIVHVSRPVLGTHPENPAWSFFNGLGSKGSLTAPHFAEALARHLTAGAPLDPEVGLDSIPPERRRS